MATYNLFDVMDCIMDVINDGVFSAEICEIPGDDASPTCLSFSAPDPDGVFDDVDYESVYSITSGSPCDITDKVCYGLTLKELSTVHHALKNALAYYKDCSKDKSYGRDILDEMKAASVRCRNLKVKIEKFMKVLE